MPAILSVPTVVSCLQLSCLSSTPAFSRLVWHNTKIRNTRTEFRSYFFMNIQAVMGLLRFVTGKGLPSLQRIQCLHIVGRADQEGYLYRRTPLCCVGRSDWVGKAMGVTHRTL